MGKLIKLMIFAGLVFAGWQGNLRWEAFKPVLAELEAKHPEKYLTMIDEAKSFHIGETKRLFHEIDTMSREAVITLRHEKWREKRKQDKKFHEKYYDDELLNRVEVRKNYRKEYQARADAIRKMGEHKPIKARFEKWKKMDPWQQRLILHEKCVKYIKMELGERKVFRSDLEISKVSTLVAQLSNEPMPVELLCNNLVPGTQSPEEIQAMVLRLKGILTFRYYTQLLQEVGIPKRETIPFKDELSGRIRDYNDS